MTIAALNWAFQQSISGPAKAVLIVLADHADQDGWCWPTLSRLTFRAGVSERTARRELRNLERDGFIAVEPGVGRGNASRYRLRYPEAVNGADEKGPHRPGNGGKTSHTGPYSESEKGPHRRLKGATPPVKGASVAPQPLRTTIEPRKGGAGFAGTPRARPRARPPRRLTLIDQMEAIRRDWNLGPSFLALPPDLWDDEPAPVLEAVALP